MASKYTERYSLCQWEAEDAVIRSDFNSDNLKIDAALREKAGLSEIQTLRNELSVLKANYTALANQDFWVRLATANFSSGSSYTINLADVSSYREIMIVGNIMHSLGGDFSSAKLTVNASNSGPTIGGEKYTEKAFRCRYAPLGRSCCFIDMHTACFDGTNTTSGDSCQVQTDVAYASITKVNIVLPKTTFQSGCSVAVYGLK